MTSASLLSRAIFSTFAAIFTDEPTKCECASHFILAVKKEKKQLQNVNKAAGAIEHTQVAPEL
jgi:hypothetical protein